jgi:Ca2+-binding RTX toxin-like protein
VSVTANGVTMEATLGMTGSNVKLDLVSGKTLAASTDLTLGLNAIDGRLLGAGALKLTGNGQANRLEGNSGANTLTGGGGGDTILGGGGNDRIEGAAGNDVLTGGAGADSFVFTVQSGATTGQDRITDLGATDKILIDLPGALPSESAWEDSHISAISGGWQVTLDDGSRIEVLGVSLGTLENALTLA